MMHDTLYALAIELRAGVEHDPHKLACTIEEAAYHLSGLSFFAAAHVRNADLTSNSIDGLRQAVLAYRKSKEPKSTP